MYTSLFILVKVNQLGRSHHSETVVFSTQGTAPPPPHPPGLQEATKNALNLVWSKRLSDDEFVLQMDDLVSGHGFLPLYAGPNLNHITGGLRRNKPYRFRLQVSSIFQP